MGNRQRYTTLLLKVSKESRFYTIAIYKGTNMMIFENLFNPISTLRRARFCQHFQTILHYSETNKTSKWRCCDLS